MSLKDDVLEIETFLKENKANKQLMAQFDHVCNTLWYFEEAATRLSIERDQLKAGVKIIAGYLQESRDELAR